MATASDPILSTSSLPELQKPLTPSRVAETTLQASEMANKSESGPIEGVRWLNLDKAKSLLKKEIVEWLRTGFGTKLLGIQTIQVTFTKCGRYAIMIGRARTGQFGLRLAVLDPHHQLCTYLLGVSLTLESALLHSAARIQSIDDDMDRIDRELKHGDVVFVDHTGYSHVAVYDAVDEVFYELIGDYESGYDALVGHPVEVASSKAREVHETLQAATRSQLKAALDFFRHEVDRLPMIKGRPVTDPDAIAAVAELARAESTHSATPSSISDAHDMTPSPFSASGRLSVTSSTSTVPTVTVEHTMPVLDPQPVFILPDADRPVSMRGSAGIGRRLSASSNLDHKPLWTTGRDRLRSSTDTTEGRRQRIASILAASGHIFPSLRNSVLDSSNESAISKASATEDYDASAHLLAASNNLRRLATSSDDIGLSKLLAEDEDEFTSVGSDASIQPDDMCPAMAFSFPSHSIAEVQATPRDSWLTRDPLLYKRVVYYANALPPDVVIARAKSAVGSPGWNPLTRNCEHFATWAKTGRTVSTQVYEYSSSAAILGASSLQTFVTLAFVGLITLWFVGKFVTANSIMEHIETIFTWLLKGGVVVSSVIFALGIFMHWQNGKGADFDEWAAKKRSNSSNLVVPSPSLEYKRDLHRATDSNPVVRTLESHSSTPTPVGLTSSQ